MASAMVTMGGGGGCPSAVGALFFYLLCCAASSSSAVDFLFDSFRPGDLNLVGDARMDNTTIRLTNDSNRFSYGRAFYPARVTMLRNATASGGGVEVSSFSTSFVFSVLPEISSSPGFGLAFVLSASTSPPGFLAGQYFGLFSNATHRRPAPLLAVEFDTGQNPEFADPDGNHVGIDLNYIESSATAAAGYYRTISSSGGGGGEELVSIDMRSGGNVRAWIDLDGPGRRIEVTLAPAEVAQKPPRPLLSYTDPEIPSYLAEEMFAGFSASKTQWVEAQRVLAWSFRDGGGGLPAREINTTGLPNFSAAAAPTSSSSTSAGLIAGVSSAGAALAVVFAGIVYYFCCRRGRGGDVEEEVEEWESKFWPHRFSYAELREATKGFAAERLLGFGGFGKVYRGVLPGGGGTAAEEEEQVAVKCMSHDSKQGLTEFMAEISSMGRLRHKNLAHMRGWCRRGTELMLVYDYMPNGSLDRWIFPGSAGGGRQALGWEARRRVLGDVAEGLQYLHHGWDQVVLHRDVKCSNILLDAGMRGRLGDFGLARLHHHGETPSSTRVVGTLGYLAPELARLPAPTAASDVYSFGVVVLEVACGRRPIEHSEEDDLLLVEWVRGLYAAGRLPEAADRRLEGEYRAEEMELVLKLGLACCHPDPAQRPSMKEVVSLLLGDGGQQQQQQQPEANPAPPPPPPPTGSEASSCTALIDGTSEEEQA